MVSSVKAVTMYSAAQTSSVRVHALERPTGTRATPARTSSAQQTHIKAARAVALPTASSATLARTSIARLASTERARALARPTASRAAPIPSANLGSICLGNPRLAKECVSVSRRAHWGSFCWGSHQRRKARARSSLPARATSSSPSRARSRKARASNVITQIARKTSSVLAPAAAPPTNLLAPRVLIWPAPPMRRGRARVPVP